MKSHRLLATASILSVLSAGVTFASAARAQTWTGVVSDDYADGRNWTGGVAPASGGVVIVNTNTIAPVVDTGRTVNGGQLSIGSAGTGMVTVRGGDELLGIRLQQPKSAQEKFFFSAQWTREGLREFQFPIVLWVTDAVAQGLAQQAPDFWSWRGGVFEFAQPMAWQVSDQPQGNEPETTYFPETLADPAALEQQILHVAQRQREPHIQHHDLADQLG